MTYACRDRAPFKESFPSQNGWTPAGTRRMVTVPFRMTPECVYQQHDKLSDPQCVGCKHKQMPTGANSSQAATN